MIIAAIALLQAVEGSHFLKSAPSPFYVLDVRHDATWPSPNETGTSQQLFVGAQGYELYLDSSCSLQLLGVTKDGWMYAQLSGAFSGALTVFFADVVAFKDGRAYLLPSLTMSNEVEQIGADGSLLVRSSEQYTDLARDTPEARNDHGYVWHGGRFFSLDPFVTARMLKDGTVGYEVEVMPEPGKYARRALTVKPMPIYNEGFALREIAKSW